MKAIKAQKIISDKLSNSDVNIVFKYINTVAPFEKYSETAEVEKLDFKFIEESTKYFIG
jgi:hypothetical protein